VFFCCKLRQERAVVCCNCHQTFVYSPSQPCPVPRKSQSSSLSSGIHHVPAARWFGLHGLCMVSQQRAKVHLVCRDQIESDGDRTRGLDDTG
jgi:hypothetical protein